MPDPGAARGIRRSLVEPVRIDFTQHAVSALLRGAQLAAADEAEMNVVLRSRHRLKDWVNEVRKTGRQCSNIGS